MDVNLICLKNKSIDKIILLFFRHIKLTKSDIMTNIYIYIYIKKKCYAFEIS